MALTPEGKVKAKVSALLKKYGAYYHLAVVNGMGKPGLDYYGCHNSRFFAAEVKAGNKQPTPRQAQTIKEIQLAKGPCFVVNDVSGLPELEDWLKRGM